MSSFCKKIILACFAVLLLMSLLVIGTVSASDQKQYVYDHANLLTKEEVGKLEALADKLGAKRKTDFFIITTNGTNGEDIAQYTGDFYDQYGNGSAAILTIDMKKREVFIAGFKKAERYLDSSRLNSIRNTISSDISSKHYFKAFKTYITLSSKDMGIKPGVNPDLILFKWWFQLIAAVAVAGIAVAVMLFNSGGRVTVNGQTYIDNRTSDVIDQYDTYIRTTVTREKKSSDKDSGDGGGVTRGGSSYSGSRGSF